MSAPLRIFVSATSRDLKSYRVAVTAELRKHEVYVVVQEDSPPTYKTTRQHLKERIEGCDAIICLIGSIYGEEPSEVPANQPRRSYTQMEYHMARELRIPVFVFFAMDGCKLDHHKRGWFRDRTPREEAEKEALQKQHRWDLRKRDELYREFTTLEELTLEIARINYDELKKTAQSASGVAVPALKGVKPIKLPYTSIGHLFKGRESIVDDLEKSLDEQGEASVVVKQTIKGLGGIGKTRLSVEYAWKRRERYTALLFVEASAPLVLQRELAGLAELLAPEVENVAQQDEATQLRITLNWLQTNHGWLLILDNADTEEAVQAVKQWMPQLTGGHVLVTSRYTNWGPSMPGFNLDTLDRDAATDYLLDATDHCRVKKPSDREDARKLAEKLDGLALALEQAASYLEYQKGMSLADYLEKWESEQSTVMGWYDEVNVSEYPASVATTWQTTMEILGPGAKAALNLVAWLDPAPIPRFLVDSEIAQEIFVEAVKAIDPEFVGSGGSVPSFSSAMAELAAYSLVHFDLATGTSFTVHRLVQEVTRSRLVGEEREEWIERALMLVHEHAPGESFDVRTWHIWDPLRAHVIAIIWWADEVGVTEPTTRLMNDAGLYVKTKGLYSVSETLYQRALEIDEAKYGSDHPRLAVRLNNLAQLYQDTNRLEEAELLMRRALAIDEAHLEPDNPNLSIRLNNLASLLQDIDCKEEAEPLMRRALAIDEAAFGPDHPRVAIDLNNLASLLKETNRVDEAEPLMRRALAIDEASYGADHPRVAIRLNNLAQVLQDTNRLEEAEPLMRRALEIDEAAYGSSHPKVAIRLNNLASLFQDTKRLEEAEPLMRRALAIDEACHGPDHPNTAIRLNNLAQLLKDTNRLEEAEPLMRRALAIDEASFGPDHPRVAIDLNNLASLLKATGRLEEAEPLMRRALAIDEASHGAVHAKVGIRLNNLASLLKDTKRYEEAEAMMRRAWEVFRACLGEDHPNTITVAANYQQLVEEMNQNPPA